MQNIFTKLFFRLDESQRGKVWKLQKKVLLIFFNNIQLIVILFSVEHFYLLLDFCHFEKIKIYITQPKFFPFVFIILLIS
jgi:hypothetical protein